MADSYVPPSNQTAVPSQSAFSTGVDSLLQDGLSAAGSFFHRVGDLFGGSTSMISGSPSRVSEADLFGRLPDFVANDFNPESKIPKTQVETTGKGNLQYPPDLAPYYMRFDFANYSRVRQIESYKITPLQTIVLPLPDGSGLNDNTSASYANPNLGITGAVVNNVGAIDKVLETMSAGATGNTVLSRATGAITAAIQSDELQQAGAFALQQAAAAAGGEFSNFSILAQQELGVTANPGMSTSFQGIGFRNFSFTWTFAPKSENESKIIKKIISTLKARSLPTWSGSGSTSLNFNYPAIVVPKFCLGELDPNGEGITTFKRCVITSVMVRYSPQGEAPSFYAKTSAPVFISLTISLQEIEYKMSEEYETKADSVGLGFKTDIEAASVRAVETNLNGAFNTGVNVGETLNKIVTGK
jgi:hypothetical protein